jgi:hypothetical protein
MQGRAGPTYAAAVALAAALAGACGGDGHEPLPAHRLAPTEAHAARASRADEDAVARLRALLSQYRKADDAVDAGWNSRVTGCMADPALGGMGWHYADLTRFDTTLDPMNPEILVYANVDGTRRLVAAEFAVPLAAWTSPEPPRLFGQAFHVNAQFQLWVLHVWAWFPNPTGVFSDWNPRIRCP